MRRGVANLSREIRFPAADFLVFFHEGPHGGPRVFWVQFQDWGHGEDPLGQATWRFRHRVIIDRGLPQKFDIPAHLFGGGNDLNRILHDRAKNNEIAIRVAQAGGISAEIRIGRLMQRFRRQGQVHGLQLIAHAIHDVAAEVRVLRHRANGFTATCFHEQFDARAHLIVVRSRQTQFQWMQRVIHRTS